MKLCAMSLVNPSIAAHSTCKFWTRSEPVNMPKTITFLAKCGLHAEIRFLYSEMRQGMLSSCIVLLHDSARPHTAAATKRLLKRFRWEVLDHPPSSVQTWSPVIFISFFVWNGGRSTFWHNELQIGVENWLKAQAAGFYDEGIGKLVPRYENVYLRESTM